MKFRNLAAQRVGVWGVGMEGRAALEALPPTALPYIIADDPIADTVQSIAASYGAEILSPAEAVSQDCLDLIIRSPGVSVHRPEIRSLRARGVTVTTILDLWMRSAPGPSIAAVTGTKGKSTVTSLMADLLRGFGHSVEVGGNIGRSFLSLGTPDFAVIEVSSYQAADLTCSPQLGVLTNLGEDHLPWHGSVEQYHRDKLQLFSNDGSTPLVAWRDCATLLDRHLPTRSRPIVFADDHVYRVEAGIFLRSKERIIDLSNTAISSPHMATNYLLACVATETLTGEELPGELVADVARSFVRLPGRLEVVPTADSKTWVNDPLASNPLAAAAAVRAYGSTPLVLILGGADRGVDPQPLIDAIAEHGSVRYALLLGEAGSAWSERIAELIDVQLCEDDVRAAVPIAARVSMANDAVLFSPAAPTTSSVGNWQDRLRQFADAVKSL